MVQGDGQLDHAKTRAQMAAGLRDRVYGLGAQLVGELSELGDGEGPRIRRGLNGIEEWGFWRHGGEVTHTGLEGNQ